MAKRFTDTDKWKKNWFLELDTKGKLCWIYVCDICDHAGFCDFNSKIFSLHLGFNVSKDTLNQLIGEKIEWIEPAKFFIPSFNHFQYGNLNPENRVHKSILDKIIKTKRQVYQAPLEAPLEGAMEEDMDMEVDKEKEYIDQSKKLLLFLNELSGRDYRLVPANLSLIEARLKSGVTYHEIEMVIGDRYNKWRNDPKMSPYLRPETLFNKTKFEGYLAFAKEAFKIKGGANG